ncbi:MAG: DUF6029 family protein [Flavobacteriales bacterium]|jgi:hypothetical protein|tara:strand:+ start:3146 stop:4807 length:1662 start_codon:yes stop_codon:yes gene_type:complete
MIKISKLIFVSLFLFSSYCLNSQILDNLTASYDSYSSYYLDDSKTGDFNFEDRFRSNNYLNLKSNIGYDWSFELQIESYLPKALLNFSPNLKETGISTFNIQYNKNDLNLSLGNFYEQFGSGMILRSWEDKDLGINNSIRGLNGKYRINDEINVTTLIGDQKKGFKYSTALVVGFDTEIDISEILSNDNTFITGFSYVGRSDEKSSSELYNKMTNLFSSRLDFSSSNFYSSLEIIQKSKDPIMLFGSLSDSFVKKGSALLYNAGIIKDGFGFDFTFRRLENMSLFSEREAFGNIYSESIVNYLPALTKQHDYSLANLYVYSSQPNVSFQSQKLMKAGEIGVQADLYYFLEKESFFGGKYGTNIAINGSFWNNLDGDFDYENQDYNTTLFGFGEKYFSELSFEIRKKWSSKLDNIFLYVNQYYNKRLVEETIGEVKSNVFVLESTFKINENKSLRLELQHLSTKDDMKNWAAFALEYNLSSAVSLYISDMYNYQSPKKENKIHYYNVGGSFNKGINRYAVNYGRQRGGLVCNGGICRYVPESTGFSLTITSSFF